MLDFALRAAKIEIPSQREAGQFPSRDFKEPQVGKQNDLDNHANQLNPNHDAYWQSRGDDERPDDWEEQVEQSDSTEEEEAKRKA